MMLYNCRAFFLLFFLFVFGACTTEESELCQIDRINPNSSIEEYIAAKSISGLMETESGLLYKVTDIGDSIYATTDNLVDAMVRIYDLNDELIISGSSVRLGLDEESEFLDGLIEGALLAPENGFIELYVPSDLAYGAAGSCGLANANEDFRIEVEIDTIFLNLKDYMNDAGYDSLLMLESGVYFGLDAEGSGDELKDGDVVTLDYTLKLIDGTLVESNPEFVGIIGEQIPGFDDGLKEYFSLGTVGTIAIPYYEAYGASGTGTIGGYEHLIFDIEVISVGL